MPPLSRLALLLATAALALLPGAADAREMRSGGKLLLTGGVTNIEGAAGGGLATWAFVAGDETRDGIGGSAHATLVALPDYRLTTYGAAVGLFDRVELSYARQAFDTRKVGAALGLGRGFTFHQDVFGAKLRVAGDAVVDQDRLLPQIAIGVQYKHADRGAVIRAIGGKRASDADFYLAATKVILSRSIVLDATLRLTRANQTGLLGFGGDRRDAYSPQFEGSAGWLVTKRLLLGGEYRSRPNNLGFAKERDAFDLFAAYALGHHVSLTAAYADLGPIATVKRQRGLYSSLQFAF